MADALVRSALSHWGLERCPATLIATRENKVFRVDAPGEPLVLRLHRPGYRTKAQLLSELQWMAALETGGMDVPRPIPSREGELCVEVEGTLVDMLTFIHGETVVSDGRLKPTAALDALAFGVGKSLARLHDLSDRWQPPQGFSRPSWDVQGLLGDTPVWGRFWDNPKLGAGQRAAMLKLREVALQQLNAIAPSLDYGLIHADAVLENVLVSVGDNIHLIDFDDGGFGFRLFDIATSINRLDRHDPAGRAAQQFLSGYSQERSIDLAPLPLFRLLRSLTYVGWIIERMDEPGSPERCARFMHEALKLGSTILQSEELMGSSR